MTVRFLSQEWADALTEALNADEAFRRATSLVNATVMIDVTGGPNGDARFWLRMGDGAAEVGLGDPGPRLATIRQDYATAAGIFQGTMNPVTAFMTGRVQVTEGNLFDLIPLQAPLGLLPAILKDLEVEY